jgi:hypothetical protein
MRLNQKRLENSFIRLDLSLKFLILLRSEPRLLRIRHHIIKI